MSVQPPHRLFLPEIEIPKQWYNVRADLKNPIAPLLNPRTWQPITLDELSHLFCIELAKQELDDKTRYIDIPTEILNYYRTFRPSPLCRAYNLEKELGTPAKIYFKFEGNNTSGSFKLNSSIAQVYYAKQQGFTSITSETGAGQWGSSLAMSCAFFHIPLTIYMVKSSYNQKPFRKAFLETFGAKVIPSPSNTTNSGRAILQKSPDSIGSLGIAISEAVEAASSTENGGYALGSLLSQVILHHSVIGLETKRAFEIIGEYPDVIIGCVGGGSNMGGMSGPFVQDKLLGRKNPQLIAVEPASCPSLTRGQFAYDFCDTGKIGPLVKMYTLGSGFVPGFHHAAGLRHHGMSPIISQLFEDKLLEAVSVEQTKVFEAAVKFAQAEGILAAPETAHAIWAAIQEALKAKESGQEKVILFGLTGTGYFDMEAYDEYSEKELQDVIPSDADIARYLADLPKPPN